MFKLFLASAASIAVADKVDLRLFGAKGRESLEKAKAAIGDLGFEQFIEDGRMTAETEIPDNGIYVGFTGHNTAENCNNEVNPVIRFGTYTDINSGCNSNSTAADSMFFTCNGTHIIGDYYGEVNCAGGILETRVLVVAYLDSEAGVPCSTPVQDNVYYYQTALSCQVGPSSLKGNGNAQTQYSRLGDVCSEACLNPNYYTVYYSGECLTADLGEGQFYGKISGCSESVEPLITLDIDLYSDAECATADGTTESAAGSTECFPVVDDDDFTESASTFSCQTSVPGQCTVGSASRVGLVTSFALVLASVLFSLA